MSDFQAFTDKGGRYLTTNTASVSMNHHGFMNVPESVRTSVLGDCGYLVFHADHDQGLLAFEPYSEESAPPHAYTLSGERSTTVLVEKPLAWVGKRPPEEHTMFELRKDEESGFPYIDVSGLPEVDDDE